MRDLEFKEATVNDYDALVEFWNQSSGWDQITRNVWEDRFINTPYGPSVVLVIESNGKLIANLIVILFEVTLGQKTIRGCRPYATFVDNSVKNLTGYKYIIQLLNHGIKVMKNKGYDLLVMLPDPRWRHVAKLSGILSTTFPLYRLALNTENNLLESNKVITKLLDYDSPDIDVLCNKMKSQNVYMVSRNKEFIKWKNSHRDYKLIGVYRNEILEGIATYLEKPSDKQIQICDVLIPNNKSQKIVFTQISRFINQEYCNDPAFNKIVILVPASFKKSLIDVGYIPDDYQFHLAIKRLNPSLSKEEINILEWYCAAND